MTYKIEDDVPMPMDGRGLVAKYPFRDMKVDQSFAIPADSAGVSIVNRATSPRPRNLLKAPIAEIGWSDSFVIFDNVFVPWDRVFMCGEWQAGGRLASLFAICRCATRVSIS